PCALPERGRSATAEQQLRLVCQSETSHGSEHATWANRGSPPLSASLVSQTLPASSIATDSPCGWPSALASHVIMPPASPASRRSDGWNRSIEGVRIDRKRGG